VLEKHRAPSANAYVMLRFALSSSSISAARQARYVIVLISLYSA
jgi:hypothetical protein